MAEKQPINFEDSMQKLEGILEKLSSEEITLDERIALYAKAAQLIQECNENLGKARRQVEEIGVKLEEIGKEN
ncbi:MAG: exodeoxyribonuclease VII small subunit, partial [Oscillospiraceae bacterium]